MPGSEQVDGPTPDHDGSTDSGRPLTRREMRARSTGVATPPPWEYPAAPDAGASGNGALPAPGAAQPGTDAGGPAAGADPWELAVSWSLRHELPAALPTEPEVDVDDVRWDPVLRDPGSEAGEASAPEAAPDQGAAADWARYEDRALYADRAQYEDRGLGDNPGLAASDTLVGGLAPEAVEPPVEEAVEEAGPEAGAEAGQPRRVSILGTGGPEAGRPRLWQPPPIDVPGFAVPFAEVATPVSEAPAALEVADGVEAPADLFAALPDAGPASGAVPPTAVPPTAVPPTAVPPTEVPAAAGLPTLGDLLATRRSSPPEPAEVGWRGTVRRLTGGVIAPAPGATEQQDRDAVVSVQRSLDGPRTVVVINPKGGAHKTTAALLIAATFGRHRGGYTLAWDNNETRGTLGWRSRQTKHHNTAVDLLDDLERFADVGSSLVGDLDNYVRSQASAQFDVLASDEDAASAASIDDFAFRALHRTLSRFYRLLVIDTGNNMRASNWQAAIEAADQVVVVSTMREDTAQSAAWALDALRATGHADVVRHAVTVLSQPAPRRDAELATRLHDHFGRLTREVFEVPYDSALVAGGQIDHDAISDATRRAWLHVTAAVADGL